MRLRAAAVLAVLAATVQCASAADYADPPSTLHSRDLGVIINTDDPLSKAIGNYYVQKRQIPPANVARIRFDASRDDLPAAQFSALRLRVQALLPAHVQAYAITWARPYRVGCMSVTSAFALGLDPKYCASGCAATRLNPYFNAPSSLPYDDLHIRPTMAVAAADFATARQLIDRGVQADGTFPRGAAYLVSTGDVARSVRSTQYARAAADSNGKVDVHVLTEPAVRGREDILFYFTGAIRVPDLQTNRFLPGAIADHLTSYGGMLTDSPQMSSLRWIEAGSTGSYGTVVEPCAIAAKFPDIPVLVHRYVAGETLIEAYWKSVAMPGQGIFIGEPLAAPFRERP